MTNVDLLDLYGIIIYAHKLSKAKGEVTPESKSKAEKSVKKYFESILPHKKDDGSFDFILSQNVSQKLLEIQILKPICRKLA